MCFKAGNKNPHALSFARKSSWLMRSNVLDQLVIKAPKVLPLSATLANIRQKHKFQKNLVLCRNYNYKCLKL